MTKTNGCALGWPHALPDNSVAAAEVHYRQHHAANLASLCAACHHSEADHNGGYAGYCDGGAPEGTRSGGCPCLSFLAWADADKGPWECPYCGVAKSPKEFGGAFSNFDGCNECLSLRPAVSGEVEREWISVKDRLPEDGTPVLLWAPGLRPRSGWKRSDEARAELAPWGLWSTDDGNVWTDRFFTHWMPLPDSPAILAGKEQ